jgi:hypothetical protein
MAGDSPFDKIAARAKEDFFALLHEFADCTPNQHGRAPCPIHKGDDPSAFLARKNGTWSCFSGCGEEGHGDAVEFLVRLRAGPANDAEARTAVMYELAPRYGIELKPRRGEHGGVHEKGYRITTVPSKPKKEPDPYKPTKPTPDTSAMNGGERRLLSVVQEPRALAVYPYRRADGELIACKVRKPHPERGKSFSWHHADGRKSGEHDPLPDEYRGLVYRQPELREAADDGETLVVIGEGEKVVDALRSVGFTATSHHGGASATWGDEHAQHLARFQRVALFPDNDLVGRSHMERCAATLATSCPDVVVRTVTIGNEWCGKGIGDVVDFIAVARSKEWSNDRIYSTLREQIDKAFNAPIPANSASEGESPADWRASHALVRLADVEREDVAWLWPGYLPAGKLVLIDGDPGVGKSQLTMAIAAAVTTGQPFPQGTPREPGDVVFFAMEDDAGSTLRPRAEAAGADVQRIVLHQGKGEARTPLQLPRDAHEIRKILAEYPTQHDGRSVRLIVVDPIMSHVEDKQGHPDARTREALGPLVSVAQDFGVTVLAVRHFTKKTSGVAMNAGSGSVAFAALARVVLQLGKDPNDESRRVLAMAKSNLGPTMPSVAFRIADANGVPYIEWDGTSSLSADDLLAARADTDNPDDRSAREEVEDWIEEFLSAQPGHACGRKKLAAAAKTEGYAERTFDRALNRLRTCGRVSNPKRVGFGQGKIYTLIDPTPIPASSATTATLSTRGGNNGENSSEEPGDLFSDGIPATSSAISPIVADVAELAELDPIDGWDDDDYTGAAA